MLIFKEFKKDLIYSSCLALGVFDGVHLGHQRVILEAIKKSQTIDAVSTVVTFSSNPRNVLGKTKVKQIIPLEKKLEIFEELGVQAVMIIDFTLELSQMRAYGYLKNVLVDCFHPKYISVGFNHHFGKDREGNGAFLKKYAPDFGYDVNVMKRINFNGEVISSSAIRTLLSAGEVKKASEFLGKPFSIKGKVVSGKQRGRLLGFPTANIDVPPEIVTLKSGVYAGYAEINGKIHDCVINYGKRPTYSDIHHNLIETYIFDFNNDLYGKEIEVNFIDKIRNEIAFSSEKELQDQIKKDIEKAVQIHCNIKTY